MSGTWSSPDLQLFPSVIEKALGLTIAPRCRDSTVLRVCNVSAAVIAEITFKVTHVCQVSDCHPKGKKARVWKGGKKSLTCVTLFNFARWAKQCGVAARPSGLVQTFPGTREAALRVHRASLSLSQAPSVAWILMHHTHRKNTEVGTTS